MKRQSRLQRFLFSGLMLSFTCGSTLFLAAQTLHTGGETIVMIRHGEKPPTGLGQLTCRGLNRALALAPLLIARYGRPGAIYAPDPAVEIQEGNMGPHYSYVRPLATIEPTAIRLGMPVNTQIAYDQIAELQQALLQPAFAHSLIFVAWEHDYLYRFAQQMLQAYGEGASQLPPWPGWDYGTIYVFHITRPENGGKPHATLTIQQENLGGKLTNTCPGPE
ncbi:MAG: hypothetical protein WCE63_19725 [Acidobacteriaceae bacterium]